MRIDRLYAFASLMAVLGATPAFAQSTPEAMTPAQVAVACAQPPEFAMPRPETMRVVGGQGTFGRRVFGERDLLVISGGTNAGLQLGQRFFLRRAIYSGPRSKNGHFPVRTAGWIRIVAANETTALASVDRTCGEILYDDYLDPFVEPVIPDGAERVDTTGELDFDARGHVVFGQEFAISAAPGNFMLIDSGSDAGVKPGARFAIYRTVGAPGMPLEPVGEGVVISVGSAVALMRINAVRDVVQAGDFVVPRKP